MNSNLKVGVIGAGALGSLIGGLLAEAGANVMLVNPRRREHMEAIQNKGLMISTQKGNRTIQCHATSDLQTVKTVDLFVLCVKAPQTEEAVRSSTHMLGDHTVALSLQNGIGCEEMMSRIIGEKRLIGAMTMQGGEYISPGKIRHANDLPTYIGELNCSSTPRINDIGKIFEKAGIKTIVTQNIRRYIWRKVLYCLAFDPISAICQFNRGELFDVESIRNLIPKIIQEGVQVGRAEGILLEEKDVTWAMEMAQKAGGGQRLDLPLGGVQIDLLRERKTDMVFKTGAIVEFGKKHGIPTPINSTLWAIINALERNFI